MREKEDRLLPAADIWTSGAEMLPVLLEELKSASLPAKQQGGRESGREGRKPENTLVTSLPHQAPSSLHTLAQQVAGFQSVPALSSFLKANKRRGEKDIIS